MSSDYYPRAVSLQSFEAFNKSQLSFKKGDVIKVLSFDSDIDDWWEVLFKSKVGIVPSNHFVLIEYNDSMKVLEHGTARYSFFHPSKAYLSLNKGDEVKILANHQDGWSEAAIGSQRGLVPTDYIKVKVDKKKKLIKISKLNGDDFKEIKLDFKNSEKTVGSSPILPPVIKHTQSTNDLKTINSSREISENKSVGVNGNVVISNKRDHWQNLIASIFSNNSVIIQTMARVHSKHQEEMAKVTSQIAMANNWEYTYLTWLIRDEIKNTKANGTLFRRNSLNSHALTHFCKQYGSDYLVEVLSPHIKKLLKAKATNYELKKEKLTDQGALSSNIEKVNKVCQEFLDAIIESRDHIPIEIKKVCAILRREVESSGRYSEFPKTSYTVIGGLFILRFLNPAIVTPHLHGIVPQPLIGVNIDPLITVSKVLQNLANEITQNKEGHMEPMMNFIHKNLQNFEQFVDAIIDDIGDLEFDQNIDLENIIAPIEETNWVIKFGMEHQEEIVKNWNFEKSLYKLEEDSLLDDFKLVLSLSKSFTPTVCKIHPANATPQNCGKSEYVALTKDELDKVTQNTKKKLLSSKYTGCKEEEKEALLKIELMRAMEKKKKSSFEVLFKIYHEDKKYQSLYKESKKAVKEVDEYLYNLEKQEQKIMSVVEKRQGK